MDEKGRKNREGRRKMQCGEDERGAINFGWKKNKGMS